MIYINNIEMSEGMGQLGQRLLTATLKHGELVLVFRSSHNASTPVHDWLLFKVRRAVFLLYS
jgi:hypothetical protein